MKHAAILICALVLAVLTAPLPNAETVVRIEYHPDPCRLAAAYGRKQQAQIGGVKLSYETFYYAVCEKVRESIVESISARADQLRGDLEEEARVRIDKLYQRIHTWLGDELYKRLPPEQRRTTDKAAHLAQWLNGPDRDIDLYVNHYFHENFSFVAEQLKAYQNDSSVQIVSGLGELWDKAKKRLQNIVSAKKEIDANPDTPVADILKKYGLSGEWIDRFQGYEGRFDRLNKQYNIVDTARTIHGAFTAETYSGRIEGMFSLMERFGGMLSDSEVPGVSLMGTLIEAYGQLAKEVLARANELENTIRQREGFCIGLAAHSLDKKRQFAFADLVGQGIRACPLDTEDELLRDIYVQAQPQDAGQLYFWRDGRFIRGIAGGGGAAGLRLVRDYIRSAAAIHVSELAGKENDLATIIAFYNTPYTKENYLEDLPGHRYRSGFAGLLGEADSAIDAIRAALANLEQQLRLDETCGMQAFDRMILDETTLRRGVFPAGDHQELQKLKLSYVLGYVRIYGRREGTLPVREAAYRTYSRVWRRLKDLSTVVVSGEVLRKGADRSQCADCAGAAIDVDVTQGSELAGCEVRQSDARGRFTARIVTRSPQVALAMSARAGDGEGERATIDSRHLGLDGVSPPFNRSFQVNLFLPSDVDEADLESRLSALRELDGRSSAILADGRAACGEGRQLSAAVDAGRAALLPSLQFLQGALADTGLQIEGVTDFAARLERDAGEAQRLGLSATEAKQETERLAVQVCETTRKLRDTGDDEARAALFENLRGILSSLRDGKATLDNDASEAANLADGAEAKLEKMLAAIETLAGVEQNLSAMETARGALDADVTRLGEVLLRLETSVRELASVSARADDLAAAIGRLSDALPQGTAAGYVREAESLRSAMAARLRELSACEATLQAALEDAGGLQSQASDLSKRYREHAARMGGGGFAGQGDALKARAADIRASADVAEVMADAAAAAWQEAGRCFALAESVMTLRQDDDLASAASAALDTCDFSAARTALEKMGPGDTRTQLAARYRAAVDRERTTNDLFEKANTLYADKRYDEALALLEQARANTACDSYRDRIALSIATLRGEWGNSIYGEAEAAIDACDFTRAKRLLESPGFADHPGRGLIASAYISAYEREKRTNDLWSRASEALGKGNHSEARALLMQAGENTRCSGYRDRITAALAQIPQAEPDVSAKPDKGMTSEVAPSGRTRPVFQSLEEARARCKQMGFDLARKNPDGPGFICGLSKAPQQKPQERVYYDYKEAKKACDRRNMLTVPHAELGKSSRGWVCFPKFPKRVLDNVPAGN